MIYDISPPISERLSVWPGDTPPRRQVLCDLKRGDSITLSTLQATVHLGAHADAPSIDERNLDYYLGPCQVIRVSVSRSALLVPAMLPTPIVAPRVLLATGT